MSVHSDDSLFVLILLFNSIMAPQYDAIIVGAGPAGLSAGITLAKNGKSVLVFDKQVRGTIFPRGETIHRLPFVEQQILYPGFYERQVINHTNRRIYYSSSGKKSTAMRLKGDDENLIFEYGSFIEAITTYAEDSGVKIQFGTQVTDLLEEGGVVNGVKTTTKNGSSLDFTAKLIIGAGGYDCIVANNTGVRSQLLLNPIMKVIGEAPNFVENRLEFHFVSGVGYLPGVCFIFPRGGHRVETGYSIFPECLTNPSDAPYINVAKEWERLLQEHPTYSRVMQGLQPSFKAPSFIPFTRLLEDFIPKPGVILVGDAVSQVEPMGGSGINAALEMGYYVAQASLTELFLPSQGIAQLDSSLWKTILPRLLMKIRGSPRFKKLQKQYMIIPKFKRWFFKQNGNPAKMDHRWWAFNLLLKLR
ncbi:MAG: monooxygenase [Promethearchaeota archaeon CR_4]|nr:MAG: monooxygenase [Candidatus Lokiarchaeota archaeon CR_4]